ncbi:hypothetical protein RHSIM_Rhsim03G0086900 [Rhododendron simsii]|uniref:Uncharacterized protein n=1 Tax=Rhododendron simsii TaxID=118357 RepID=A0A834LTH4_RHOSS|nr:hypothetical protein RHSIM_Rhsim03G0086900 [Rhododendron simsii]
MANDTRSSWGSKDDENNSSIKKPVSIKESSTLGSAMMDTSGFRKSIREMPLQKQMSSSPSTRSGSEHLDRPTPTTFAVKRKSEIVEKQRMPSPLRRSDRGKEHASLGCSDFNKLQRPEAISKIDSSYCGGSVSKPVDDREDGGENRTSRVDAAAPPLSECKRDNIAGTHVPCSERLRYLLF